MNNSYLKKSCNDNENLFWISDYVDLKLSLFHFCSHYEDYLSSPFPFGSYKQIFIPPEIVITSMSLGASMCIFSSQFLFDEKVIDQVISTFQLICSFLIYLCILIISDKMAKYETLKSIQIFRKSYWIICDSFYFWISLGDFFNVSYAIIC